MDATGKSIYSKPFTEMLIHAEVLLPQGENVQSVKVQRRTKDDDGNIVGIFDSNSILNTTLYDV